MGRKRKIMNNESDLSLQLQDLSNDLEELSDELEDDSEEFYIQSYEDLNIPYCKRCGEVFIKDAFTGSVICSLNVSDCPAFKK
jgi:hypothetical protein